MTSPARSHGVAAALAGPHALHSQGITHLATAGWLIAVPLGYLLDRFLVWLLNNVLNLNITVAFPAWNLALTLAGTILLALLITFVPIRRATHLRPGDALRYA